MENYVNKVILINIKKDDLNPHQHYGFHPYVVVVDYGSGCLIAPCTSSIFNRTLPTQVKLKTRWDRESMVLLEQMFSVSKYTVASGKYCAALCEEDIRNMHEAVAVQFGLRQDVGKNITKGKVYYLNLPQSESYHRVAGVRPYILISNDLCNKHSPVVHVIPMARDPHSDNDKMVYGAKVSGYALLENILLIPKSLLTEENCCGTLKRGSVYAINAEMQKLLVA